MEGIVKEEKPIPCSACLLQTTTATNFELTLTYKELLGNAVDESMTPYFCEICSQFLTDIRNFKSTCLTSLKNLTIIHEFPTLEEVVVKLEDTEDDNFICFTEDPYDSHYESPLPDIKTVENTQKLRTTKKSKTKKTTQSRNARTQRKINSSKLVKQCNICNIQIPHRIKYHIIEVHMTMASNGTYSCNICKKSVKSEEATRTHFNRHNDKFTEPKKCEYCGEAFVDVCKYDYHVGQHQLVECHYCGKKFPGRSGKFRLRDHIYTRHMSMKKCYHCFKLFTDMAEYKEHMKWESENRPKTTQVCDICGFEAACTASLHTHKGRLHPQQTGTCTICNKTFKSIHQLKGHNKQHHEALPYACEFCGKKFVASRPLRVHIENVHHRTNYLDCDICGRKLLGKDTLARHKKVVHTTICNYSCKICGRAFKTRPMLVKHTYSHQNKRPFNCHLCTTGYYCAEYLQKHYSRVHGIEYATTAEVRKVCRKLILDPSNVQMDTEENVMH